MYPEYINKIRKQTIRHINNDINAIAKLLGITNDQELNFDTHVDNLSAFFIVSSKALHITQIITPNVANFRKWACEICTNHNNNNNNNNMSIDIITT